MYFILKQCRKDMTMFDEALVRSSMLDKYQAEFICFYLVGEILSLISNAGP